MEKYSDTTQQVFLKVIESLEEAFDPGLLQLVQEAIDSNTFHQIDVLLIKMEEFINKEDNANK